MATSAPARNEAAASRAPGLLNKKFDSVISARSLCKLDESVG
jgi:hypothetical protein